MNNNPSTSTAKANKSGMPDRKEWMRSNDFFRSFPVVVLACSNYISNQSGRCDINEPFNVKCTGVCEKYSKGNWFFSHKSEEGKRLVIQTRQLSANVDNKLLMDLSAQIRSHLI